MKFDGDSPEPSSSAAGDLSLVDPSQDLEAPTQSEAFVPKYLSPSSAGMFRQCPRKWKHRYVDRLPDPPGEPALVGTFAHRVLELLLQMPPEQRTKDRAKTLAREVWPEIETDADFNNLGLTADAAREFRWRSWLAIEGLWHLEDPATVTVEATEQDVQVTIGGVPFRGIIDRVDVEPDGLIIADYKSGKAPSQRFAADKLDQVLLYAAALSELSGIQPAKARLLYLNQRIIEVEVTAENLGEVTTELQDTWKQLHQALESDEFETSTGPLCAWCPFIEHCPDGQAEVEIRHLAGRVREDAPGLRVIAAVS